MHRKVWVFSISICFVLFSCFLFCCCCCFFFSRECNIEGGEGVKEMWSVILLGCTNLCSVGQISNRYKCSSTRTERKMKIT